MEYTARPEVVSKHCKVDKTNKEQPWTSLANRLIYLDVWYLPTISEPKTSFRRGNMELRYAQVKRWAMRHHHRQGSSWNCKVRLNLPDSTSCLMIGR